VSSRNIPDITRPHTFRHTKAVTGTGWSLSGQA